MLEANIFTPFVIVLLFFIEFVNILIFYFMWFCILLVLYILPQDPKTEVRLLKRSRTEYVPVLVLQVTIPLCKKYLRAQYPYLRSKYKVLCESRSNIQVTRYILRVTSEKCSLSRKIVIYYSKQSNMASKPWSGMIHLPPLAVVTEEKLLHDIIQKNQTLLPGGILKPWS